jgi:hypothetical protein
MSLRFQPRPFTHQTPFHCRAPHAHQVSLILRSTKEGAASTHPMHKLNRRLLRTFNSNCPAAGTYFRGFRRRHPMLDPASRGNVPMITAACRARAKSDTDSLDRAAHPPDSIQTSTPPDRASRFQLADIEQTE